MRDMGGAAVNTRTVCAPSSSSKSTQSSQALVYCVSRADLQTLVTVLAWRYDDTSRFATSTASTDQLLDELRRLVTGREGATSGGGGGGDERVLPITLRAARMAAASSREAAIILSDRFLPPQPENEGGALGTKDIDRVMRQYTANVLPDDFEYCGTVPSDFLRPRVPCCVRVVQRLLDAGAAGTKGKTKFGLIMNTDPSDQGGSHWVGLYGDRVLRRLEYFDSFGDPPTASVREITRLLSAKGPPWTLVHNRVQYQEEDGECGTYAISFVLTRAHGGTVSEEAFNDVTMRSLRRDVLFLPPSQPHHGK